MTNQQAFIAGGILAVLAGLSLWVWWTDQKNEALAEKNVKLERDQSYEANKAQAQKMDPKDLQSALDGALDDVNKGKS